ncbi:hypothetical protein RND71_041581 [Anisodus tanguticus]|uniref:Uncharacterized protein n=1 Tax=Anisodus tanguticus TaxID=243964 RepID=A0AAE1UWU5_9SOLA|nr:hypothetical protein RND71_041581 [Anisodus tanguticus]
MHIPDNNTMIIADKRIAKILETINKEELEVEKKKKESIQESKMVNNNNNNEGFWWNEQVDDMGIDQLEEFMSALGELKKKVTMRADELSMINGSSSSNSSMKIARFGVRINS